MSRRLAFVAVLSFACIGCDSVREGAAKRTTQLPGFEIQLPYGLIAKSTVHPGSGSHHVHYGLDWSAYVPKPLAQLLRNERGTIKIHWRAGARNAQQLIEDRQMMATMMVGVAAQTNRSASIDEFRWVDTFMREGSPVAVGNAYCQPGLSITVIVASRDTEENLTERTRGIVESVVCKTADAIPELPDPNLNLTGDFGRVVVDESAAYISLDGISAIATVTSGDLHADRQILRQVLQNASQEIFSLDSSTELTLNDLYRYDGSESTLAEILHASLDSRKFLVTLYCEKADFTVMAFFFGAGMDPGKAGDLASRIDCSFAPTGVRSLSQVFGESCAAGNARACADLSAYVSEGSALADFGTALELRERACEMGVSESCTTDGS